MTAIKLSFKKLESFLEKNGYTLTSVYCESKSCVRFAECRTPQKQKIFLIYVPSKYSLIVSDPKVNVLHLSSDVEEMNSRQVRYLADIKGTLTCDLVAISSSELCWYKNSTETQVYELREDEEMEEPSDDVEQTEISKLEKEASKITERIDPNFKKPKIKPLSEEDSSKNSSEIQKEDLEDDSEKSPEEPSPKESSPKEPSPKEPSPKESSPKEPSPKEDSEKSPKESSPKEDSEETQEVELIFEDSEGKSVDDVAEIVETDVEIPQEELSEDESVSEDVGDYITRSNDRVNIQYSDIVLGMIYPSIDLGSFFKKAKWYEKEILTTCEQIDENILEIRKTKLKEIKELSSSFLKRAEERLEEINQEEKRMRCSLTRLTVIQIQIESLKKKASTNPKLENELPDVEKIQEQTHQNIHDLNVELLKIQDSADELLNNYQSSIRDLMDL